MENVHNGVGLEYLRVILIPGTAYRQHIRHLAAPLPNGLEQSRSQPAAPSPVLDRWRSLPSGAACHRTTQRPADRLLHSVNRRMPERHGAHPHSSTRQGDQRSATVTHGTGDLATRTDSLAAHGRCRATDRSSLRYPGPRPRRAAARRRRSHTSVSARAPLPECR